MIAQSGRIQNENINVVLLHNGRYIGRKENRPVSIQAFHLVNLIWIWLFLCTIGGTSIAQGYQDYQTWDMPDGAIARFGKGGISYGDRVIAFSPDRRHLAVAATIGVWLYDVKTTREVALFSFTEHSISRYAVAFSPDGAKLAVADAGVVKLWDVSTQTNIVTLKRNEGLVWSVAFSPDGKKLAVGGSALKLWEIETGRTIRTLTGHTDWVNSIAISPDGTRLVSGASDKTIKLWEVESGKNINTFEVHTDEVLSVAFSPDGTKLASGSRDYTIKLWEVETGRYIDTLGHTSSQSSAKGILRSIIGSITKSGDIPVGSPQ